MLRRGQLGFRFRSSVLLQQRGTLLVEKDDLLRTATANEQALRANAEGLTAPLQGVEMALRAVETRRSVDTVSALYAAVVRSRESARLRRRVDISSHPTC